MVLNRTSAPRSPALTMAEDIIWTPSRAPDACDSPALGMKRSSSIPGAKAVQSQKLPEITRNVLNCSISGYEGTNDVKMFVSFFPGKLVRVLGHSATQKPMDSTPPQAGRPKAASKRRKHRRAGGCGGCITSCVGEDLRMPLWTSENVLLK